MKTNQSNNRAEAVAVAARLINRRGILAAALIGFCVGVVSAAAYLLLGGEYFLSTPRWADIVFYPGFAAGFKAYDLCRSEPVAKIVGVIAVGLAYGLLAGLGRLAWRMMRNCRASQHPRASVSK